MTTAIERYRQASSKPNTIFVSVKTYWKLKRASEQYSKTLDDWAYAGLCRSIEPRLKMFHDNHFVVYGD